MSRVPIIEGEIARIPLTQGKFAIVDACDIHLVNDRTWYAERRGHTFYARGQNLVTRSREYMHTVLSAPSEGRDVDHADGDGLNNRRSNLRRCAHMQNTWNQRPGRTNNTSGFRGVSWAKRERKWVARIVVGYKQYVLGLFDCPKEAAKRYDVAALSHFREFAVTNQSMGLLPEEVLV